MAENGFLTRRALAAAIALALLLTLAACLGGEHGSTADKTATPTTEETTSPAVSPTPTSAQGAVIALVENEGLGGETYTFFDQVNCRAEQADDAMGEACIDFVVSMFTETEGSMTVRILGTDEVWSVSLELSGASWVATGATRQ